MSGEALTLIMDARVIGVRKHAVLRTAMPAHDRGEGKLISKRSKTASVERRIHSTDVG
jgi:hypothetical protein